MYQKRRKDFVALLPENSIALFFSGKAPYKVGDEKYPFSVDRNFYYLSGLDKENMVLMLVKTPAQNKEYLFIEHYDEDLAKWVGGRMMPEEASKQSGIEDLYWIEEGMEVLGSQLSRAYSDQTQVHVFADFTKQEPYQADNEAFHFTRELLKQYPYIQLQNAAPLATVLRLHKDDVELTQLKQAIHVTKDAILNMMRNAKEGMYEHQLEAHFDFVLKSNACEHSFNSIIAGGKNATILHYVENNQKVKNRSLVLCDLGASYQYMNADITRTFPISGTFTKRQREVYDIVLAGNKLIMELVKPGVTLRELDAALVAFYQQELKRIGLLKHGRQVSDYYWHSVSHMLGLETHDVTLPNYKIEAGNVFTIEPGLYIEEESIGIRIEDNVLVTQDGCINLSADIIKEADDIEAFMKQG